MTDDTNPRARTRATAPAQAPGMPDAPSNTDTVSLDFPISLSATNTEVASLTLRRPTVRDRMNVTRMHRNKSNEEQEIIFLANLCGIAPEDIEKLDLGDYNRLQDVLSGFMPSRA